VFLGGEDVWLFCLVNLAVIIQYFVGVLQVCEDCLFLLLFSGLQFVEIWGFTFPLVTCQSLTGLVALEDIDQAAFTTLVSLVFRVLLGSPSQTYIRLHGCAVLDGGELAPNG